MYVIVPVDKPREYGMHKDDRGNPYVYLPPWDGPTYEPAVPDEDGNFLSAARDNHSPPWWWGVTDQTGPTAPWWEEVKAKRMEMEKQ